MRRIPAIPRVVESYKFVFRNFVPLLIVGGPWIAVGLATQFVAEMLNLDAVLTNALMIPVLFSYVLVACVWHRFILHGIRPTVRSAFVLSGREWRYFGLLLLTGMVAFVCTLLLKFPGIVVFHLVTPFIKLATGPLPSLNEFAAHEDTVTFIIGTLVFGILFRISLILPGTAIGDRKMTIRESWRQTKGNTIQMLLASTLCWLPSTVFMQAKEKIFEVSKAAASWFPDSVTIVSACNFLMETIVFFVATAVAATFLSLTYRERIRNGSGNAAVEATPAPIS